MRHPIEKYNNKQAEVLANLPEDQREWMARMFRIGNATYCYYNRAKELAVFDTNSQHTPPARDGVANTFRVNPPREACNYLFYG